MVGCVGCGGGAFQDEAVAVECAERAEYLVEVEEAGKRNCVVGAIGDGVVGERFERGRGGPAIEVRTGVGVREGLPYISFFFGSGGGGS